MPDKIVHKIHLDRYAPMPAQIQLGTAESYGVEQIAVVAGAGWDGLDIVAVYHPPKAAEPVRVLVPSDGLSDVPPEATASAGRGALVIAGMADGVQIASCNIAYTVIAQAGIDGATGDTPTPDLAQQILSAANGAVKTAEGVRADMDKVLEVESGRATAEADRAAAESARVEAETARVDAEGDRAAAEQSRVKAETDRVTSETARKDAESKRANAEQERQTAEEGRVEAESSRVKAEAEREKQLPALKSSVNELRARQNILVGSETGNPVSCNDAYSAPLCGLTIYGKSTQDGTPPPDAPVPIVSAGDGGTVTVKVTGVNLLDLNEISDLVLGASQSTVKDGHITGTTKSIYAEIGFILKGESAQYTVSLSGGAAGVSTELRVYIWDNNSLANNVMSKTVPAGEKASCTFKTDGKHEYAVWFRPNGVSDYDFYDIQLELGSTVTAYEPYHEQLLTLQTPTGLPGIPVTSGGNYTDSRGQQWVCDEVDLAGEVMVQRIDKAALDDTKPLAEQNAILATPIETPLTADEIAAYKALTAYAPDTVVQASDGAGVKLEYQRDVNIAIKKLEDAVASMTTT